MNAPVYIVPHELAELRAMGTELQRLCDLMDDTESERGFLANWFRSIPDALHGPRSWHEVSDRQTKFRDINSGAHYTNPCGRWEGLSRIKRSPEFRDLTGDRKAVAEWALDFDRGSHSHVWHASYQDMEWVRAFFQRIAWRVEGIDGEAFEEAENAFLKCDARCQEMREEEESAFFASLDRRPPSLNGTFQPSYKTSF